MKFKLVSCLILCVILGFALSVSLEAFGADDAHGGEGAHHGHGVDGAKLPIWSIIPFVGILLSIAIFSACIGLTLSCPSRWKNVVGMGINFRDSVSRSFSR